MMQTKSPTELLKRKLAKLSTKDVLDVQAFVADLVSQQATDVALERRSADTKTCLHCGEAKLQRWGRSKAGTQRFKCENCKATFGATTGTPFYRLRNRHLWSRYLRLMGHHIALWRLRDEHGLPLSIPTLHRWRHRFLSRLTTNPERRLAGLIEADEKFFRTSFKGSRGWNRKDPPQLRRARRRGNTGVRGLGEQQAPTLTAMDRSGAICQTRLSDMKWPTIEAIMAPWIEPESVICSDGNLAYERVAQQTGCEHITAKVKWKNTAAGNAKGLSIGRIDAYHRDVENLINRRCMGVATRYLMNYFGWARRITQHQPFGNDLLAELLGA
jgi:transposase-like protein